MARSLKARWPDVKLLGVGGERMAAEGVQMVSGIASAMGLVEALGAASATWKSYKKVIAAMAEHRPQVVVLIDYPDFNFRVGKRAREMGIKVLYYVSPQVWAWREGRVKTMQSFIDRMAVLLPFEQEYYKGKGISCEFVGHPVMEDIEALGMDKDRAKKTLGLQPDKKCIALLPGSRRSELERLLPVYCQALPMFKRQLPGYDYLLALAPNVDPAHYEGFAELERQGVHITKLGTPLVYYASEAAVVASGTAALQATFCGTAHLVVYKLAPVTHFIMKLIVKVNFANLTNLIVGREVVPELLQDLATPQHMVDTLASLIGDQHKRSEMQSVMDSVRAMFAGRRPSERVAQMIGELAQWTT